MLFVVLYQGGKIQDNALQFFLLLLRLFLVPVHCINPENPLGGFLYRVILVGEFLILCDFQLLLESA